MTTARWYQKADSLAKAWRAKIGLPASKQAIEYTLCVAQHETLCGDAWAGEHNWGACTLRPLNASELAVLSAKGIHAPPPGTALANIRAAEALARQALLEAGLMGSDRALHWDCTPRTGYFTWFAAFGDDVSGAAYLVKILVSDRPTCATQLRSGTLDGLARAMYATHYYTGIHTDPEANITDYDRALLNVFPGIEWALATWYEGSKPAPEPQAIQVALNKTGAKLTVDGIPGPLTRAAVRLFQGQHSLPVSGLPDLATLKALGLVPTC